MEGDMRSEEDFKKEMEKEIEKEVEKRALTTFRASVSLDHRVPHPGSGYRGCAVGNKDTIPNRAAIKVRLR